MRRPAICACLIFLMTSGLKSYSQVINDMEVEEERLIARTKQVNQFFRRFNGEEDINGNRLNPGDKDFRSAGIRKNYLRILVDNQSKNINSDLYKEFTSVITDKQTPYFLDFHAIGWTAQVDVEMEYNGRTENGILFMEIEKERLGYKWVIDHVYFHPFVEYFIADTAYNKKFLHPMSHEIEFMNLRKIFDHNDSLQQYFVKGYKPDQMSLFLYEAGRGFLKFGKVTNVKFHFFQVPGWYFELTYINRGGYNSGWMITNLVRYKPEEEAMLRSYIYYEK